MATKETNKATKKSTAQSKKDTRKSAPVSHGVGRRKSSVARTWLRKGSGQIRVNDKLYSEYFDTEVTRIDAFMPMTVIEEKMAKGYDIDVDVQGGGKHSQAGAVKLGIARALLDAHEDLRSLLREHGLLTVDSRVKERKKYGQRGARRKFQFVKR